MTRMLSRAGVADHVLKMIPEICQTCRVCREWAKPGPSRASNLEFPDRFNQQVECDLMLVGKHIIFHMIDRCTRWHAAKVIQDKTSPTLSQAIDTVWCTIHGPPNELIVDGESGIVECSQTLDFLARKGIKLHERGKSQHARFIERRGALLRDTIHKIQSQVREEGLTHISFDNILAEAVFCGNAMLSINGSSPYNAVYGRVPDILPGLDNMIPNSGSETRERTIGDTQRLREISVQAMVEGSSRARVERAMNTKTTISDKVLDLTVGDEVDSFVIQAARTLQVGLALPRWLTPRMLREESSAFATNPASLKFSCQTFAAIFTMPSSLLRLDHQRDTSRGARFVPKQTVSLMVIFCNLVGFKFEAPGAFPGMNSVTLAFWKLSNSLARLSCS